MSDKVHVLNDAAQAALDEELWHLRRLAATAERFCERHAVNRPLYFRLRALAQEARRRGYTDEFLGQSDRG